jgi:hypothetical protein
VEAMTIRFIMVRFPKAVFSCPPLAKEEEMVGERYIAEY